MRLLFTLDLAAGCLPAVVLILGKLPSSALDHPRCRLDLLCRTSGQLDCNALVNSNTGCGVRFSAWNSFGPSFNDNGGGWFAMERNNNFIKVWFWPRNSGSVPSDMRNGAQSINTGNWVSAARFLRPSRVSMIEFKREPCWS